MPLGLSVLYIAMTGDNSDLFTSLPAAMLGANYSRKFESEADLYALQLMDRKNIEVSQALLQIVGGDKLIIPFC